MDLSRISLFGALNDKMAYLAQRQSVLAENIANADTPGYQPRDLKPFELQMQKAGGLTLRTSDPRHLTGLNPSDGPYGTDGSRRPYEVAPSGNAVVLEEQVMKASRTNGEYQLAAGLYQRNFGMLRNVLRGGAA